MNRSSYLRVLALGCFDILLTLPLGIANLVDNGLQLTSEPGSTPFWLGWTDIHTNWGPVYVTGAGWSATAWSEFTVRWDEWINVLFAVIFFLLFGLTEEARSTYRQVLQAVFGLFGRRTFSSRKSSHDVIGSFKANSGTLSG